MKKFLLSLSVLLFFVSCGNKKSTDAKFVWQNETGDERAAYVMFRNEFEASAGDEAVIHLFADSRYHLLVNGSFVNFGPTRFYPENPLYDSYNISAYLRDGKNAVGVKVLNN